MRRPPLAHHPLPSSCLPLPARLSSAGRCQLDLELLVEERCNMRMASFWPVNSLRNRAVQLARSEALLLLDVDFVVGGMEQVGGACVCCFGGTGALTSVA